MTIPFLLPPERFRRAPLDNLPPCRDCRLDGPRSARRVDEHIEELKALGVAPPSKTPLFYRVSASRLTVAEEIETSW